jgi:UDP-glucose:tetrahydrobiopterin glucosyltransferase
LRILFVAPPVGPIGSGEAGGVETHLLSISPLLVQRGHQVGIVAPAGSVVPVAGVTVHQVAGEMSPSATRADRAARTEARTGGVLENMWERAREVQDRYDLVIGVNYDWLAFYLTPFFATPVGHWVTIGSTIDNVDRIIEERWRAGGLRLAMYTEAQVATFPFLQRDRIHLLYGAVDTAVFRFGGEPGDRLCWAGRISPEKGLEDAIAAARVLGMPLDVCGRIQDDDYWKSLSGIVYHGFLAPAELQQRYASARVTLVTPRWVEAFGNVVIESMACGTPVAAYDRGGPAEIIEHGKNGILVTPGDVAGLVAGARAAMLLDRRAVRARAEEFSLAKMADRMEAWVRSILALETGSVCER